MVFGNRKVYFVCEFVIFATSHNWLDDYRLMNISWQSKVSGRLSKALEVKPSRKCTRRLNKGHHQLKVLDNAECL